MRPSSRTWSGSFILVVSAIAACSSSGGTTTASSAGGGGAATTTSGSGGFVFAETTGVGGQVCGHELPPTTPTCDGLDASAPPTFAHDIAPLLTGCTGEVCHGVPNYEWLVGRPTLECCDHRDRVTPGDPAKSYLVTKLSGVDLCGGRRMPYFGGPLPAAEQATIVAWICAGAPRQ